MPGSIGRHGNITADQARNRAKEIMGDLSKGENPVEEIAKHRRAPTVAALCERFFKDHFQHRCNASTQSEYRRAIDLFINPAIGNFEVLDLERRDVSELHHKMRDKPYQANRVLGVLSKMFNLFEVRGLRPDGSNACRHVPKFREEKRERFPSRYKLQRLGQTLTEAERDGTETPCVTAAFRLLILTGCRLSEIQTLQWSFITDQGMELPDTKTGARRIPITHVMTRSRGEPGQAGRDHHGVRASRHRSGGPISARTSFSTPRSTSRRAGAPRPGGDRGNERGAFDLQPPPFRDVRRLQDPARAPGNGLPSSCSFSPFTGPPMPGGLPKRRGPRCAPSTAIPSLWSRPSAVTK